MTRKFPSPGADARKFFESVDTRRHGKGVVICGNSVTIDCLILTRVETDDCWFLGNMGGAWVVLMERSLFERNSKLERKFLIDLLD